MQITILKQYKPLWDTDKRNIVIKSGRGAGKSWAVAQYVILKAIEKKYRILCTREIQRTIRDSVYKLLCDTIERYDLQEAFDIQRDRITSITGSEIFFTGLWQHAMEIKSMEGINICWVEEAQSISQQSLEILVPTIRAPKSKIIYTYNPYSENDAIYLKFIKDCKRMDTLIIETSYLDNPFLDKALLQEAEWDKETNYSLYRHKWLGEFYELAEGQVFAGKYELMEELPESFDWLGYGLDFGYAEDPNVLIKIGVKSRDLYVIDEKIGKRIEINDMPKWLGEINGLIVADSARPELISYLNRNGYKVIPAQKGKNSVLEGIEKIRSFNKIKIYKECEYTYFEIREYSWKTDKITCKILPEPIDKNNHAIDAIRYALEKYRQTNQKVYATIEAL